jgi:hypothetical protein
LANERDEERAARRYLLGEGAEPDRVAFEDRFFEDNELFERLLAAEDDLVDAYARGTLSDDERAKLERGLLATPAGAERLAFARALAARAAAPPRRAEEPGAPWWSALAAWLFGARPRAVVGLAAAGLAAVALGSWLLLDRASEAPRPPERAAGETPAVEPAPAPPEQPAPSPAPPEQPAPPKPPREAGAVLAFAFAPQTTRGVEEVRVLRVPAGTSTLRFLLGLERADHASYTATLRTADGRTVLTRGGVAARRSGDGARVVLDVDAGRLAPDEYVLTLTAPGAEGDVVADYIFRVERATRSAGRRARGRA